MIKYKRVDTKNGRIMYYKNGTLTSKDEIPTGIINSLEADSEIITGTPDPQVQETVDSPEEPKEKICIFCGGEAGRVRFINEQTIHLCDEDYNSHTTGEIAAQMREVSKG